MERAAAGRSQLQEPVEPNSRAARHRRLDVRDGFRATNTSVGRVSLAHRVVNLTKRVLEAEANARGPEGLMALLDAYEAHARLLQELALELTLSEVPARCMSRVSGSGGLGRSEQIANWFRWRYFRCVRKLWRIL
jgi:hypothetical protein